MYDDILDLLPYKSSFRFVDQISFLSMDEVRGEYTLKSDSFFYADHFPGNPVTPGVIITEIMAQIGVVVLGLNLIVHGPGKENIIPGKKIFPLLASSEVSFYKIPVPFEQVITFHIVLEDTKVIKHAFYPRLVQQPACRAVG